MDAQASCGVETANGEPLRSSDQRSTSEALERPSRSKHRMPPQERDARAARVGQDSPGKIMALAQIRALRQSRRIQNDATYCLNQVVPVGTVSLNILSGAINSWLFIAKTEKRADQKVYFSTILVPN